MDVELFERLATKDEAVRLRVYDDATGATIGPGSHVIGNPTIAVGRNVGPTGPGLRPREVQFLLSNDATDYEAQARTFSWFATMDPVRQTIIALMIFNMGLRKFQGFERLHVAAAGGDWTSVAREMLDSKWAMSPPAGVGPRAERMAEMMRLGVSIAR